MILGMAFPLKMQALTQYSHISPTGVAMLNGKVILTTATGVHALDDPAGDNGVKIPAWLITIFTDFGINNAKRLRTVYLRGFFKSLEIKTRTENAQWMPATLDSKTGALSQQSGYVPGRRDQVGTYFQLHIGNVDGEDFSIDAVDVLPVVLSAKRAQIA